MAVDNAASRIIQEASMSIMIASATQAKPDRGFNLPMDLTTWIDRETLLAWTRDVVEQLDWTNPELVSHLRANPAFRPKLMLCLLTFSYASGTFGSEEISQRCDQEVILQSLCENNPPTSNSIKRFRRENRGLLKSCLARVFKRAVRRNFELGDPFFPAGFRPYLVNAATVRLDIARQMDRADEP